MVLNESVTRVSGQNLRVTSLMDDRKLATFFYSMFKSYWFQAWHCKVNLCLRSDSRRHLCRHHGHLRQIFGELRRLRSILGKCPIHFTCLMKVSWHKGGQGNETTIFKIMTMVMGVKKFVASLLDDPWSIKFISRLNSKLFSPMPISSKPPVSSCPDSCTATAWPKRTRQSASSSSPGTNFQQIYFNNEWQTVGLPS